MSGASLFRNIGDDCELSVDDGWLFAETVFIPSCFSFCVGTKANINKQRRTRGMGKERFHTDGNLQEPSHVASVLARKVKRFPSQQ